MPSCSVLHHCVLFLLTLTLTTDPGAAVCEFPIYAKLHQSVTLPCEAQCSGRGWWSLENNRTVVFAECDQTSCRSVQQGYEMSHDQYKRGDLSLTITNPDYTMRNKYTCECGYSDFATVRLRISTVSSAVQMFPGEDLKLDLSVPESVEVIYRRSDSADDVHICNVTNNNVTQRSLQCNNTYTPRTSLSNSELTLRNMWRSESGTYTIRNLDYKEDIRVYAVSVSGLTSGETAGIVIAVLLLMAGLTIAAVMYYRNKAAEWEVKSLKEEVQNLIRMGEIRYTPGLLTLANLIRINSDLKNVMVKVDEAEGLRVEAAKEINDLEVKYRENSKYSRYITRFCNEKRREMGLSSQYSTAEIRTLSPEAATEQVIRDTVAVNDLMGQAVIKPMGEPMIAALQQVEEEIKALELKYGWDRKYKDHITLFCNSKRDELEEYRKLSELGDVQRGECNLENVNRAVEKARKAINDLERKYSGDDTNTEYVTWFCNDKRRKLGLWKDLNTDSVPAWVISDMVAVDDLMAQALHKPTVEMKAMLKQVEEKIEGLEQNYSGGRVHSQHVTSFCNSKRDKLEKYRNMFKLGDVQRGESLEANVEMAVKILEELRREASAEKRVIPSSELDEMLSRAKECLENVNSQIQQWSEEKMEEWNKYKVELLATPETLRNADRGEKEPLV